jgi:D-sedoheptulose 7-phosphate isomerase
MQISSTRILELIEILSIFSKDCADSIESAAALISKTFLAGGKVLICGNGGSAADSQHFAAEFVNAFSRDLDRRALPAIALSTDTSILTSIANDFQFDNVFSRQVEAYGQSGDVLIALTTSGSSRNCLNAIKIGHSRGLNTITFTKEGSQISQLAQISIEVPSENTQHIQECHMLAYHVITELVEDDLFRKGAKL